MLHYIIPDVELLAQAVMAPLPISPPSVQREILPTDIYEDIISVAAAVPLPSELPQSARATPKAFVSSPLSIASEKNPEPDPPSSSSHPTGVPSMNCNVIAARATTTACVSIADVEFPPGPAAKIPEKPIYLKFVGNAAAFAVERENPEDNLGESEESYSEEDGSEEDDSEEDCSQDYLIGDDSEEDDASGYEIAQLFDGGIADVDWCRDASMGRIKRLTLADHVGIGETVRLYENTWKQVSMVVVYGMVDIFKGVWY
ncbi:hypothetical protein ABW19_dt0203397 [Dactylella cylindrospora]|nr:hypothetical protein ABW19_dt0203397 [Dactylella cylindrospora]